MGNALPPRKIIVCIGQHCNRGGRAEPLYAWLEVRLGERKPPWVADERPLVWGIKNCLSRCELGPNVLAQPDARYYHHVTLDALAAIVADALPDSEG